MKFSRISLPSGSMMAFIVLIIACIAGYYWMTRPTPPAKTAHEQTKHGHQSMRNGMIANIGDHHVELVLGPSNQIRAYILGKNEWETLPIEAEELLGEVKFDRETESHALRLKPEPKSRETRGNYQFVGYLPKYSQKSAASIVLNIPIGSRLYRARFSPHPAQPSHLSEQTMPEGVAGGSEEEQQLYLTPGGAYSSKDIMLNGNTTPSVKFKNIRAEHDMHPKIGDPICPITFTKANAKFYWWINGQKYLFCCPPCIDEFVSKAKKEPNSMKPPSEYIKREDKT